MPIHVCPEHCLHSSAVDVDILRLVAGDFTNPEIGQQLGRSPKSIRNRLTAMLVAFGARSRTGLVVAALQEDFLRLADIERRERR